MRLFKVARWRTKLERRRIRLEACMVCYRSGPSFVFDACAQGYPDKGWLGRLWPLCESHRWEVQQLGWRDFLTRYNVDPDGKVDEDEDEDEG